LIGIKHLVILVYLLNRPPISRSFPSSPDRQVFRQLNNITTYSITRPIVVSVLDDAIGERFATCASRDFAISGGYTLNNQSPKGIEFFTVADSPFGDNAWKVRTFSNFPEVDVGGNVTVKCFDNPPLRP
jgi:hypothetical protein